MSKLSHPLAFWLAAVHQEATCSLNSFQGGHTITLRKMEGMKEGRKEGRKEDEARKMKEGKCRKEDERRRMKEGR